MLLSTEHSNTPGRIRTHVAGFVGQCLSPLGHGRMESGGNGGTRTRQPPESHSGTLPIELRFPWFLKPRAGIEPAEPEGFGFATRCVSQSATAASFQWCRGQESNLTGPDYS